MCSVCVCERERAKERERERMERKTYKKFKWSEETKGNYLDY